MYKGYARIIDVRWTPVVNILIIRCGRCDALFEHRADRWTVVCSSCKNNWGLTKMRDKWRKNDYCKISM